MSVVREVYRQNPECQNPEFSGFCHEGYAIIPNFRDFVIPNFRDFVIPNFRDFVIKMSQNPSRELE